MSLRRVITDRYGISGERRHGRYMWWRREKLEGITDVIFTRYSPQNNEIFTRYNFKNNEIFTRYYFINNVVFSKFTGIKTDVIFTKYETEEHDKPGYYDIFGDCIETEDNTEA